MLFFIKYFNLYLNSLGTIYLGSIYWITFLKHYNITNQGIVIMDKRLLIVLIPVLAAASWALYNIGRAALQQLRSMGS